MRQNIRVLLRGFPLANGRSRSGAEELRETGAARWSSPALSPFSGGKQWHSNPR